MQRGRRHRAAESRISAASARCAALHNAQNAACAAAAALALGLVERSRSSAGCGRFPASRIAWRRSAARARVLFVNDSKATNADAAARALASFADIFWIAGGKPKTGGITASPAIFPRIRKAYLIGEAAPEFAATLEGKVPYEIAGTLDSRGGAGGARCRRVDRRRAGGAAVARLRVVRPVSAISRCAATPFRDLVLALPGVVPSNYACCRGRQTVNPRQPQA